MTPEALNVFCMAGAHGDGCTWWRMTTGIGTLAKLGHETHVSVTPWPSRVFFADAVVGHRVSNPNVTPAWQKWAEAGKHLVFDLDDHLGAVPESSPDAHKYFADPQNKTRLDANLRAASVITAATERLADWASQFGRPVRVIPNGLPADALDWGANANRAAETGTVVLGWTGSMHTLPELIPVAPALRRVLDDHQGRVELHLVGAGPEHIWRAALIHMGLMPAHERGQVRITPWAPPGEEYLRCVDFDIWVAVYRDIEFNKAKVPTKAIEASVLGVPLVVSNVGAYPRTVKHGESGLIVHQPYLWVRHLDRLVRDDKLRERLSAGARARACRHIVEGLAPLWEEALTPGRVA